MKAFVVEKYGKSGLRAAQAPDPTVGPRDVLVRVSAASINPLDMLIRTGQFKLLLKYKTPFVLGHDLSGTAISALTGRRRVLPRHEPSLPFAVVATYAPKCLASWMTVEPNPPAPA